MCESGPAVAADPDVALVVDEDAVVRVGPFVALARSAPVPQQVARLVELEDRRRARAALTRLHLERLFVVAERRRAAMDDPDVIVGVHPDADRGAENPVIRQRLRPQRVHFEPRRLDGALALGVRCLLEHRLADRKRREECDKAGTDEEVPRALQISHAALPAGGRFARDAPPPRGKRCGPDASPVKMAASSEGGHRDCTEIAGAAAGFRECAGPGRGPAGRHGPCRRAGHQDPGHDEGIADLWRLLVARRRPIRKDRRQGVRRARPERPQERRDRRHQARAPQPGTGRSSTRSISTS